MKQINNTIDLKEEKKNPSKSRTCKKFEIYYFIFFPLCHPRPIVEGLNKSFTVRITIRIFSFGAWKSRIYRLVVSNQLFIRHDPFECKRTSSRAIFPPLSLSLSFFISFYFSHRSMDREMEARYESRLIWRGVIRHLHRIAELIIIFYPNDRIGNVFPCIMHVSRRNTFARTVFTINSFRGNICLANGIGIKRRFLARFEFFVRISCGQEFFFFSLFMEE